MEKRGHREFTPARSRPPAIDEKIRAGTMNTVSRTEELSPPIIARASGAYCSLPVPIFSAIGTIPMIVASDVTELDAAEPGRR